MLAKYRCIYYDTHPFLVRCKIEMAKSLACRIRLFKRMTCVNRRQICWPPISSFWLTIPCRTWVHRRRMTELLTLWPATSALAAWSTFKDSISQDVQWWCLRKEAIFQSEALTQGSNLRGYDIKSSTYVGHHIMPEVLGIPYVSRGFQLRWYVSGSLYSPTIFTVVESIINNINAIHFFYCNHFLLIYHSLHPIRILPSLMLHDTDIMQDT
jgi:hypothetical protein